MKQMEFQYATFVEAPLSDKHAIIISVDGVPVKQEEDE